MKEINYFGELLFLGLDWPKGILILAVGIISVTFCISVIVLLKRISNKRMAADIGESKEPKKDYYYDILDDIFVSHIDKRFKVRVNYQSLRKHEKKDGMIISSSYPHEIDVSMLEDFRFNYLPQVQRAEILDTHRLYLVKSPAASFFDYQILVLDFMFKELHDTYCFDKIKQEIIVETVTNPNILILKTNLRVYRHLNLYNQIKYSSSFLSNTPIWQQNEAKDVFDFSLYKNRDISWLELRPEIMKIIESYFSAGVIWKGEWEKKASFSIHTMKELFDENMMRVILPEEFNTKNHSRLEIELMRICGVVGGNKNTGMLADMDVDGPVFFLRKENKASWEEVLSEAKIVIKNYFNADINWEILINKKDLGK